MMSKNFKLPETGCRDLQLKSRINENKITLNVTLILSLKFLRYTWIIKIKITIENKNNLEFLGVIIILAWSINH